MMNIREFSCPTSIQSEVERENKHWRISCLIFVNDTRRKKKRSSEGRRKRVSYGGKKVILRIRRRR